MIEALLVVAAKLAFDLAVTAALMRLLHAEWYPGSGSF